MDLVMKKQILKFQFKFTKENTDKETVDNEEYATWMIQLSSRNCHSEEDPLIISSGSSSTLQQYHNIYFDVEPKDQIKPNESLDVIDYKFKAYENGILRSIRHISEEANKLKWRGKISDCNWPIISLVFDCYIEFYRPVNVSLKIVSDFEKLFTTSIYSDVTLKCNGDDREFKVHKAILSVRSPVFAAMFDNNLEEKKKNAANIQDIDSTVLKDMILFMYCGKITNFENTCELFVAADKYQIEDLMDYCYRYLLNNINESNLIQCLRLAETYDKKELKQNAIEFFIKNESKMTNLMENKAWKDMVSDCPGLANEIMRAFFAKLNKNKNVP